MWRESAKHFHIQNSLNVELDWLKHGDVIAMQIIILSHELISPFSSD